MNLYFESAKQTFRQGKFHWSNPLGQDIDIVNFGQVSKYSYHRRIGTSREGCYLPSKLNNDELVLAIDKSTTHPHTPPLSVLWISRVDNLLQISYGYTQDSENTRRRGYNTRLRLLAICIAFHASLQTVVSIPFEGAHSSNLCDKLAFVHQPTGEYVLDISRWTEAYLVRYLDKYLHRSKN